MEAKHMFCELNIKNSNRKLLLYDHTNSESELSSKIFLVTDM